MNPALTTTAGLACTAQLVVLEATCRANGLDLTELCLDVLGHCPCSLSSTEAGALVRGIQAAVVPGRAA